MKKNDEIAASAVKLAHKPTTQVNGVIMDEYQICTPTKDVVKFTALITPTIAKKLLEQTDPSLQRRVSAAFVKQFSNDMAAGNWKLNHVPVQQDQDGNLIDGQHRMLSCIKSGAPYITDMVKGVVYSEVMDTIDTGRSRTKTDILSIMTDGVKYQGTVTGAIDFIYNVNIGRYANSQNRSTVFTNHQIREWLEVNVDILNELSAYASEVHSIASPIPNKMAVGLRYIFSKIDPVKGRAFFEQFNRGIGLTDNSPIFYIRNQMAMKSNRLKYSDKLKLMVKAWNDFYENNGRMRGTYYKVVDVQMPPIAGIDQVDLYNIPLSWVK